MNFIKTSIYSAASTTISLLVKLITNKIIAVYLGTNGMFLIGQLKDFLTKQNDALKFNDAVLTLKGAELDRNVGEYYEAQAKKGTNFGGFINAFLSGVGRETSGYTNIALDIASATGAGRNPNFKDDLLTTY